MRLVVVESPFASRKPDGSWDPEGVEENLRYLRAAMRDCLLRGEAPYASHALYTQPGVLDDQVPSERALGMSAGFSWNEKADATVVYVDRGLSGGMVAGIKNAVESGRPVEVRHLRSWWLSVAERGAVAGKSPLEIYDDFQKQAPRILDEIARLCPGWKSS